jgi:tripartite-type tricarboxylate transporter receptor subunit TctC
MGADLAAKAPPDGYTVLMSTVATPAINPNLYSQMPYDAAKDFAPIVLVATLPNLLVVNPSLPARNVKELIALAKAKPGGLAFASAGNGTSQHLSGELFKKMTGVDMIHIPYKGSAPRGDRSDRGTGATDVRQHSEFVAPGASRQVARTGGDRTTTLAGPSRPADALGGRFAGLFDYILVRALRSRRHASKHSDSS